MLTHKRSPNFIPRVISIVVIGIPKQRRTGLDLPIDLNRPPRTSEGDRRWTDRFAGALVHLTGHPRRPAFAGCRSSLASKPNCAIALARPSLRSAHRARRSPSSYGQTDEPGRRGKSHRDRSSLPTPSDRDVRHRHHHQRPRRDGWRTDLLDDRTTR